MIIYGTTFPLKQGFHLLFDNVRKAKGPPFSFFLIHDQNWELAPFSQLYSSRHGFKSIYFTNISSLKDSILGL